MNLREFQVALQLWDIHSLMCAQLLMTCWRAEQLARSLRASMTDWDLLVGANVARALVETTAAFTVEAGNVRSFWEQWKNRQTTLTPEGATEFRLSVSNQVFQFIMGTRQTEYLKGLSHKETFKRTNILTFIDKAAKQTDASNLRGLYEALCDAVHPSFGSNELFITEMGYAADIKQQRVLLDRDAKGRSELPSQIRQSSIWALERLTTELAQQKLCCDDLCLTLKLWCLDADYFGIVYPE